MDGVKSRSFTVRATSLQALSWGEAARFGGYKSTSSWLAAAGDYLCQQLSRRWQEAEWEESGEAREEEKKPEPLSWRRGRFRIHSNQGQKVEVHGSISEPFAVFREKVSGHPKERPHFCLVHLPSGRVIATLSRRGDCLAMAAKLLALDVPWQEEDPEKVARGAPDERNIREVCREYSGM
jgi:hypothetical protein